MFAIVRPILKTTYWRRGHPCRMDTFLVFLEIFFLRKQIPRLFEMYIRIV